MKAEIFGVCHIVFVSILLILIIVSLCISNKFFNDKTKLIFTKIMGGLILVCAIGSRLFMAIFFNKYIYLIPNSFCGLTGYLFGLSLLIFKPDNKVFNCLWYMAFIGGLVTMIYPDFLAETPDNFFHPKTIFCMIYHALMLYESIMMVKFKQFKFELKYIYILPIGMACYLILGYIEIYLLNEGNSMCLLNPILDGTILYGWTILIIGSLLATLLNYIIYKYKKSIKPC